MDNIADQIIWPGSSDPHKRTSQPEGLSTFTEHSSSSGIYRGFCNQYASSFIWRCGKKPEEVGIATGDFHLPVFKHRFPLRGTARMKQVSKSHVEYRIS